MEQSAGIPGERTAVEIDTTLVLGQFGRTLAQARRAYREFMEEGLGQGHVEKYYDVVDQRFLGDEEFIEKVDKWSEAWKVEVKGSKVPFSRLLEAVAEERGIGSDELVRAGRHRRGRCWFI